MIIKIAIASYGGLSLIAAILQSKYKNIKIKSAILMGIGGLVILASLLFNNFTGVYVLTFGTLITHISAIINGYEMYGKINKPHHFLRLLVGIFLVASYVNYFGI